MPVLPLPTDDTVEALADGARHRSRVFEDAGQLVAGGVPWDAAWDLPYADADAFLRGLRAAQREQAVTAARGTTE